jgi:transcriptional regulator with XRE-family HTH domain/Zn-dependent peptidase ImmA (M78 family)
MKSGPASLSPDEVVHLKKIGERIRVIRRQRGLMQTELAKRVGMRPGPINAIEKGRSIPSTGVIVRLAKVLGVTVQKLFEEKGESRYIREDRAPYGRRLQVMRPVVSSLETGETAPIGPTEPVAPLIRLDVKGEPYPPEMLAMLDAMANAFLTLEDLCGVPKQPVLPLSFAMPLSEQGLEDFVYKIRVLLGIGHGVIFDYVELFENAGLRVLFVPLPEGVFSASCYDPESRNAFLFVTDSKRVNTERKLFHLIRELGRIYCHTGRLEKLSGRTKVLDAGHVASKFAAFFLMPCEAVMETVRQVGVAPDGWTLSLLLRLKHRFGVSAESFLYRLGELDLVTPAKKAEMKKRIHADYEKSGYAEPGSSRRMLNPNGRLGDLLEAGPSIRLYPKGEVEEELRAVRAVVRRYRVKMP